MAINVVYHCSCARCGWKGARSLHTIKNGKPCPKCKHDSVYVASPRVAKAMESPNPAVKIIDNLVRHFDNAQKRKESK